MALNLNSVVKISAVTSGVGNIDTLNKKLRETDKSAFNLGSTFAGMKGAALGALAGIVGVGALATLAKGLIDVGDKLWTLHERTGVAVEDLSKFQGAAEQSGTSLEAVAKGMTKLNKALGENDDNAKLLRQLGIDTTNATTAMLGLADIMQRTEDPALRSALAMQLFGKNGAELVPMLAQGREEIEGMSSAITTEFAQAADEFNDSMNAIKRDAQGLATEGLVPVLDAVQDVFAGFKQLMNSESDFTGFFEVVGVAVRALGVLLIELWKNLQIIGVAIGANIAKAQAFLSGDFERAADIDKMGREDIARLQAERDAAQRRTWYGEAGRASAGSPNGRGRGVQVDIRDPGTKPVDVDATLRGLLSDDAKKAASEAEKAREREAKQRERALQQNREAIAQLNAEAQSLGLTTLERERATAAAQLEAAGIEVGTQAYKDRLAAVDALHAAKFDQTLRDTKDALDEEIDALRLEIDQIGMSTVEIELSNNARKMDLLLKRLSKGATEEETAALRKLIDAKRQEMDAEIKRKDATKGDWMAGAKAGLRDYYESVRNTFADVQGFISNSLQKTEDALVEFFSTGKLNFKAFVSDLLKELLRLWVRAMIMKPILDMLGVKFPALGQAMGGRALGGAVAGGSAYVVGENGPEIFRPAQSGRIIPNGQMGRMGGGGDVNISISVATDGSTSSSGDTGDAMKLGRLITAKVRDVITQEKRVGGLLAGAR